MTDSQLMGKLYDAVIKLVEQSDKLVDLGIAAGLGVYGYHVNEHWSGALTGLLGYKLARSENIVAGGAGVTILAALGVLQLTKPFWAIPPEPIYTISYHGPGPGSIQASSDVYASK